MGKNVPKKRRKVLSDRNMSIYREYCRGYKTVSQIAKDHGITQGRTSFIIKTVSEAIYPLYADHIKHLKVLQTHKLDMLYGEAVKAWERSCNPEHSEKESYEDEDSEPVIGSSGFGGHTVDAMPNPIRKRAKKITVKREVSQKSQYGDPRLLAEARMFLSDIRKIWGLDDPLKVDVNNRNDLNQDNTRKLLHRINEMSTKKLAEPSADARGLLDLSDNESVGSKDDGSEPEGTS